MEISLCMIVKDESSVIERCLNSVRELVDEIIIVDTGSCDDTVEKAKSLGAIVYNFKWINDFSKARNFSFSKATKDYIFWLDADDILNKQDICKFKFLKENLDINIDSVTMNYILSTDENGKYLTSLKRNRLVKRTNNFRWIGSVHEYLEVYGNIINSDINIIHKKEKEYSNRNLLIFEELVSNGKTLSARDLFYYANELFDNNRYDDAIKEYKKFLSMEGTWIEDVLLSCSKLADCYNYKNDIENEIKYILESFKYDMPRPEFCCRLGYKFLQEDKLDPAIYWYETAINLVPKGNNLSIINHDTYTYLPWIQLCVCYFKKGNIEKAYICNEMAAKYKPNDKYVRHNREYFNNNTSIKTNDLENS